LGLDKGEKFYRVSDDHETNGEKEERWKGLYRVRLKRSRNFSTKSELVVYVKLRDRWKAGFQRKIPREIFIISDTFTEEP